MLLIYSIILLAILLFALFKGKNLLVWSLGAYQISSYTIVIALLIYNIIINYNYSLQSGLLEKAGYYIVLHLKIHIADIVVLYNLGNALLLASVAIFLIISGKKAVLQKLLLFIPPILYYIINHPRFKYKIWNYCISHGKSDPLEPLVIINSLVLIVYFLLPLIHLAYQYRKTKIFSKKKYILGTSLYIFVIEFTMGFILFTNPYSNYYPMRCDINSMPVTNSLMTGKIGTMFSVNSKYTELFLSIAIVILVYIIIYCDFSLTFNITTRRSEKNSELQNDEMLKTIFHKYKNAFFAIDRFSSILESNVKTDNIMVNAAIENIKSISQTSYEQSRQMLDSIILSYDFTTQKTKLNLTELLNELLLQFQAIPNLSLTSDFPSEDVFINGSRDDLKEAFTNIINNSVEATEGVLNPSIKVSLFTEDGSAVINFYDNGCGIRKNDRKKIFRPLYSSKQSSNNMGIGLSTVLKTINYHSGTILCKSRLGEYTIFQVILPAIS